ncbi:BACON domain-containing protein [uncultured Prevotella sp.]|uniref:BACON domain-containing protein n=1 Tax=uncultured Prevotella sp. TaxID=159272 RepID=UPI0025E25A61|nr:BACON domain-containing protein [uncultured Prevotella sp.]
MKHNIDNQILRKLNMTARKLYNSSARSTAWRLLLMVIVVGSPMTSTAGVVITGNVYGGGNLADVGQSVTVNISSGVVEGDVYGGGAKAHINMDNWVNNAFTQTYHAVTLTAGTSLVGYYYMSGGNYTAYTEGTAEADETYYKKTETKVNITGGEIKQDVYGGGLGYDDSDNDANDVPANVYGDVTVTMTAGKARDVFGANNVLGTPKGVIAVNINGTAEDGVRNVYGGGNQATYEGTSTTVTMTAGKAVNVYGGGLSANVSGSVTVNIQGGTVTTDVYGGGALGDTNIGNATNYGQNDETINPATYTTTVNLTGGSIGHDVYGGGLGRKAADAVEAHGEPGDDDYQPAVEAVTAVDAKVYGNVTVNIGTAPVSPSTTPTGNVSIGGSVFGCNNANGTPKGDVLVNVYKTAHTNGDNNNQFPDVTNIDLEDLDESSEARYAIKAVYGGGNLAHYTPVAPTGSTPHSTTVYVYGCSENTVKAVYGGGNAANVGTTGTGAIAANTNVIIDGGRFYNVFGGGNGAGDNNPGANIYGTAKTEIRGGLYNQVFGGSDSKGNITNVALSIEDNCNDYPLMINESFGGANMSDLTGNITTTLTCNGNMTVGSFYGGSNQADITGNVTLNVFGGTFTNVFGGSKGITPAASATQTEREAASADISGDVTLNLYGGTMENAFGGSNINGRIHGKITVNVLDNEGTCPLNVTNNIYGAGNVTPYEPDYTPASGTERISPVVNIIHGTVANVFGGAKGSSATVEASPQVNIGYDATTMGNLETENSLLYNLTQDPNYTSQTTPANYAAIVTGNVYGGGDLAQVSGNTQINLRKSNSSVGTIYGGGNLADVSGNTAVNVNAGTVTHDVYGGGALANVGTGGNTPTTHQVTIAGGTITGNVYGGGLGRLAVEDNPATNENEEVSAIAALVNGAVTVTVSGGKATNVFGCNNINGAPQSTVTVNVTGTDSPTSPDIYTISNVYGGGNVANYTGTPIVTVSGSSYVEKVFGGGNEASVGGTNVTISTTANTESATNSRISNVYGGGNQAGVTGNTLVSMTSGNVLTAMYGGCNTSGTVGGTSTVTVTGGTIGSAFATTAPTAPNPIPNVLFGGGKGSATSVTGKTTLNVGTKTVTGEGESAVTSYAGTANIYGNVYGGSEEGEIHAVDVNLYGNTIYGNVFGGGYQTASGKTAATTVNVILDGTKFDRTYTGTAQIFGCNNLVGTPLGQVNVHVFRTAAASNNDTYHVAAVYGGGNEADYVPTTSGVGSTQVIIEGCNQTSIDNVYGGGNAAAVPGTEVWILGSTIINNVYGGGNGERGASYAAHVGFHRESDLSTTNYSSGTGKTEVNLVAGTINDVYGGSNSNGDIRNGADVKTATQSSYTTKYGSTPTPNCCDKLVTQHIYGGGSQAEMSGDVNVILECMPDDYVDAVYGGAANATINGNVTLTVTSGKFGRVFGGNNQGGSINGTIRVVAKEEGCKPLEIGELYGGGNQAPYSKYGCEKVGDNWVPNTSETEGAVDHTIPTGQSDPVPYAIDVLVESCTSIGKIFGGGNLAEVIGNTHVEINMFHGNTTEPTPSTNRPIGTIGQVFGGGNEAKVTGSTTVDIGTDGETIDTETNTVLEEHKKGVVIASSDQFINPDYNPNDLVNYPLRKSITAGIYGGGNAADVDGDAEINIGTAQQSLGINITADIFGGGYGETTTVTGNVAVNIGTNAGTNESPNYVGYANITGDVYGGSAKGKVNATKDDNWDNTHLDRVTATTGNKTTTVNFYGGTISDTNPTSNKGNIYGGGYGRDDESGQLKDADVYGPITVNVYEGCSSTANVNNHVNNVFGCNNQNGTPKSTVVVNINGGTVSQSVYGGGNQAIMDGSPVVNVTGGIIGTDNEGGAEYGNVYGGGLGSNGTGNQTDLNKVKAGLVKGNTRINVSGGTILHNIYGGGAYGSVGTYTYDNSTSMPTGLATANTGKAEVYITGGTIGTDGNENGMVFGSSRGDVGAPDAIHDKLAWVYDTHVVIGDTTANATVTTSTPLIKGSVYGGGENGHNYNDASVRINGGTIGIESGSQIIDNNNTPADESDDKTYTGAAYPYRGNVYGAGCGTDKYWIDADNDQTVDDGEKHYNPLAGIVQGNVLVNITGGHVVHNIYGAGAMGSVGTADVATSGLTKVSISDGTVGVSGTVGDGNVFGAARGSADAISNEYALVRRNTNVTVSGGTINGNVYGGGELGCVGRYVISNDMRNFYWTDTPLDDINPADPTTYAYNNTGVCNVNITGSSASIKGHVFGGGKGKEDTFWCEKGIAYKTNVTITNGTVDHNVYGGGQVGRVENDATVKIGPDSGTGSPEIKGDVFGAGAGVETHGYSALVRGNTYVTIQSSAKVHENVYGGGELAAVGKYYLVDQAYLDSHSGTALEIGMPYSLVDENLGVCNVTVKGSAEIGYNGTGHLYGGGKGKVPSFYLGNTVSLSDTTQMPKRMMSYNSAVYNNNADNPIKDLWGYTDASHNYVWEYFNTRAKYHTFLETLALATRTVVSVEGSAKVNGSVYGGSESGFVQHNTSVTIKESSTIGKSTGGTVTGGDVYGGGLGLEIFEHAGRVSGNSTVNINGGNILNSVYGGGAYGVVKKNVTVNVSGGIVVNDVYGGGALADTNTENWNANGYEAVSGLTADVSVVTGLYTESGGSYTLIETENQKAASGTTYYQKGTWATDMNDASTGTTYKTIVNLNGGIVGNAYGGGLGRKAVAGSDAVPAHGEPGDPDYTPGTPEVAAVSAVAAMVYGDVTVTVNGAKFHQETAEEKEKVSFIDGSEERTDVPITKYGRVFGANNANGTPKGNIMVNVKRTIPEEDNVGHRYGYYEIHSVYGGGNLANYLPADGKNTQVLIEGCDETSIECVYGGGNSASVPQTLVTINGTFEIGMIFGGGNGDDPVKDASGTWGPNPGADVIKIGGVAGTGTINAKGGTIRWLYGGSNKKGLCGHIQENLDPDPNLNCPLKITNVYGAGKNADVESVFIVAKCPSSFGETVEYLYGGSYNARISGDVTMTLIGGQYKNVYGGNDSGGSIGGDITINIQETYDCDPIIIGNLYGGGNKAAYPGTGSTNGSITINVKSCTHIGNIFGGGFGGEATVNGTTQVNLNMTKGLWATDKNNVPFVLSRDKADFDGKTNEQIKNAIEAEIPNIEVVDLTNATFDREKYTIKCKVKNELGTIGNVYGGGDEAAVNGTTTVNIGTESSVAIMQHNSDGVPVKNNGTAESPVYIPIFDNDGKLISGYTYADIAYTSTPVLGANITGNVYGGGNNANVTEKTYVNICAKENTTTHEYESVTLASGAVGVTIEGTERHGVFGGGNLGIVEGETYIHQGGGNVNQSVYGGGCEADVKGNTYVTMLDGYVEDGVYGGGLMGSVGTVTARETLPTGHPTHDGCLGGKPKTFKANTGKCTVVVSGGQIGPDAAANNGMTANEIVDVGFVFGAGRGDVENPAVDPDVDFHTYVNETEVTIKGTALIMASVYGGGENGRVRGNTLVKIEGGQIGCGNLSLDNGKAKPYNENQFIDPTTTPVAVGNALAECSHWDYGRNTGTSESPNWVYETYDPYADDAPSLYPGGSSAHPSDGKTYYGCVFGGGSGYYPYVKATSGGKVTDYDWLPSAGAVEGNTKVLISGGHILTNVYGGNEYTDVLGSCTVKMSGGTLGVPRTVEQIAAHPLTCYLFGAGKGDPRSHFNGMTNVGSVNVEVSGGIIYGSVFGGAEDGHVVGDVDVQIKPGAVIGTWGTSYVDGNVFGGGRGFSGENVLAGNVGGNVTMTISGGTMMGSIYGGGRLGSVGLNTNGTMKADVADDESTQDVNESASYGHVTINITGGTIGNTNEYKYIAPDVTGAALTTATANMPNTLLESNNRLKHTKGGNVFAGGMGRRKKLDNVTDITNWTKLGNVKSTKLTISGDNTWIMGNVYGGGEFGAVTGSHTSAESRTVGTEIIVTGGTIGTEITGATPVKETVSVPDNGNSSVKYTFGSIYGGGMGVEEHDDNDNHGGSVTSNTSVSISGANTKVRASVYGGGEMAVVDESTYVTVSNGEIGRNEVHAKDGSEDEGYVMFGGATMGNVYGGGKGHVDHTLAGLVKGDTHVTISGGSIYHNVYGGGALGSVGTFTLADKVAYIPDGVPLTPWTSGGTAYVTITGGTIGISGRDNGMVNGSSRGDVAKPVEAKMGNPSTTIDKDPYDKVAWIKESRVTIGTDGSSSGPIIKGSVYGGGENGHNAGDAYVTVYSGTIGIADSSDPWYTFTNDEVKEKATITRGNVYGAGCGTDTYWDDADNDEVVDAGEEHNNLWAGIVTGNTYVTVSGGRVTNNVYGGGSMGSVGTITNDIDGTTFQHRSADKADLKQATTLYDFGLSWPLEITYGSNTGTANVTINGTAQIDNYVFGGARGKVEFGVSDITEHRYEEAKYANVRMSKVVIGTENQKDHSKPTIRTVYGGGEDGHVMEDAQVTIHGGTINRTVFGGGKGTSTFKSTLWDAKNEGHNKKDPNDSSKDLVEDVHSWTAGKVYGNTKVTINNGNVGWFVYGGGNMASVGKGNYSGGVDDYSKAGYGELPSADGNLWTTSTASSETKDLPWHFLNSGTTTVNILGGTIGTGLDEDQGADAFIDADGVPYGSVFGGSRGKAAASCRISPRYRYVPDFFMGYVNKTIINVGGTSTDDISTNSPTIKGSIYGGGQDGHVRNSTEVHIFNGNITGQSAENDPAGRSGHVFGAGSGIGTYKDGNLDKVNNSSGSVTCTATVEVNNGSVHGNIYGGGALASVGPPKTPAQTDDELKAASGSHKSYTYTKVDIKGGNIGGNVYGASRGPGDSYLDSNPHFDTTDGEYDATKYATDIWSFVNVTGGTVSGSVYGGGEGGIVKHDTEVSLTGGTITNDAYGGGKGTKYIDANVNGNTTVELNKELNPTDKGCIVNRIFGCNDYKGTPKGHVLVHVYATQNKDASKATIADKFALDDVNLSSVNTTDDLKKILADKIKVAQAISMNVSSYQSVYDNASAVEALKTAITGISSDIKTNADTDEKIAKIKALRYDVIAVYGGGNLAPYKPYGPAKDDTPADYKATTERTEVIIDGCQLTSIKQVYGGGNAAPVPASYLEVNGTYEIDEAFGGGNGADEYEFDDKWYQNPGANVGYYNYTTVSTTTEGHDGSTKAKAYPAVENTDAATKELRQQNYSYGSGIATTEIKGGKIHNVYGGSNKKGNISTTALSMYESMYDDCPIDVDESYGGGKDAPIDGNVDLKMECAHGVKEMFGGAKNADVNSDINLTITNGSSLERVFGGNNTSGAIAGSITVNIEEGGCEPIRIGELYAGGYLAPYSVYGYPMGGYGVYETENIDYGGDIGTIAQRIPHTKESYEAYKTNILTLKAADEEKLKDSSLSEEEKANIQLEINAFDAILNSYPKKDPRINVISATSIGNIYGGGYRAKVVGNPHVNINMTNGKVEVEDKGTGDTHDWQDANGTQYNSSERTTTYYVIVNDERKEVTRVEKTNSDVIPEPTTDYEETEGGNTYVYKDALGALYKHTLVKTRYWVELPVGEIGNIYGGGNLADIVGDTYVEIGTGKWLTWDAQGNPVWETTDASGHKYTSKQTGNAVNYTQAECSKQNAELRGYIPSGVKLTAEQASAVNTTLKLTGENVYVENSVIYTEDAALYNATLTGYWSTATVKTPEVLYQEGDEIPTGKQIGDVKTPAVYYTQAECNEHNKTITGYIACATALTAKQAVAVNEAIGSTYAAGATINMEDAAAYIATLNGHISTSDVKTPTAWTWYKDDVAQTSTPTPARNAATITGNVFGGGKGKADTFQCEKAMVGVDGDGIANPDGGTNVTIANGTVGTLEDGKLKAGTGNVYGGGMIGRVEKNTMVTIGVEANDAPVIYGDVFGAGQGVETHGYSALVRGNPTVIVQSNSKVLGSVYGGGEIASVARYKVVGSVPVALANKTSGNCKVIIRGNAEIGPDNMRMTAANGPDDTGHVFGAGKGVLPKVYDYATTGYDDSDTSEKDMHLPKHMVAGNTWEYYTNEADYLGFIETLALSSKTDVTISDNAFVKGSVYGGSLNGIVQYNTHVTIEGDCQIGQGQEITTRYKELNIFESNTPPIKSGSGSDAVYYDLECAHWDYDKDSGAPHDPYATYKQTVEGKDKYYYDDSYQESASARGGSSIAKDGHTYYGNVFGGGSGVIPYAPGKWHRAAGVVRGNTVLDITGGHILTSIYGGNEHTDVGMYDKDIYNEPTIPKSGGLCTVNFGGTATLGVPRTLEQIAAHPVTCYLFGAGKGDTRTFFNTWTNIREAEVNITGGRIYGSVFGGGEDGHVLENVTVNINESDYTADNTKTQTLIGTTGTSYVDGNVFGAGRGFTGDAITAGSIGGNVEVNISGGTMLGSVYGGGRLASVGIGFNAETSSNYGQFTEDVKDNPATTDVDETKTYGHITVNINGGTIGNDIEVLTNESNSHTKGGNVYGGSMGRLELLDGTTPNPLWPQLGQAKTATVNISGTALIKSNVYGGGEMGIMRDKTNINISGGTVNRDVYGGGYGSSITDEGYNATIESAGPDNTTVFFGYSPMKWAGIVGQETNVNINGGRVKKSVYGGGEMASVGIINYTLKAWRGTKEAAEADGNVVFKNPKTNEYAAYATIVKHDDENNSFALSWPYKYEFFPGYEGKTNITITGGRIGLTSAEDENNPFADKDNGDVYGGGKGIAGDYNDYFFCANVGSSEVTINYPANNTATPTNYLNPTSSSDTNPMVDCVAGAVYGGAENGHVMGDTKVTLTNGLIGHSLYGGGSGKGQFSTWLTMIPEERRTIDTNTGSGTAPEKKDDQYKATCYSITAGKVFGNTSVEMDGGYVIRNVYGGGNMGSVGKGNYAGGPDDYSTAGYGEKLTGDNKLWDGGNYFSQAFLNSGKCTVKITGGTVGYIDVTNPSNSMYPRNSSASLPYGSVFGGCRGESAPNVLESPRYLYCPEFFVGYANETEVIIGTSGQSNENAGMASKAPLILGSVYGGGQDGHIRRDAAVTVFSGEIGLPFTYDNRLNKLKTIAAGTTEEQAASITEDLDNLQWLARGNVYGAGSGIGMYKYDINYDGDFGDEVNYTTPGTNPRTSTLKEEDHSTSAGSVTRFTTVNINGGIIHRNVYGGGSLSTVGAPKIPVTRTDDPDRKGATGSRGVGYESLNRVNIAGTVGTPTDYQAHYGGEVYGASRGNAELGEKFSNTVWTEVNIKNGADVKGNVFGGGDSGPVNQDTEVNVGVSFSTGAPETMSFEKAGSSKTFTVTTDTNWEVFSNAKWLTVTPVSGKGEGASATVTVTAEANTATTPRTATITITGAGDTKTIKVTQAAATPPSGD